MTEGFRSRQADGIVTVSVSRTIKPGTEAAFEAWLAGVCRAATQFEGHLGVTVLRPPVPGGREYGLIFRFDSLEHLARWNESRERDEWLERVKPMTAGEARVNITTGLEHWFTMPGSTAPPPRHKMALLTWAVIFPLILVSATLVQPYLQALPWPLPVAITSALMVTLMTYLVMPRITRLFRRWLFGGKGS